MEHFGIKLIQRKHSFKLNREEFALISTKPSLPMFESLIKKEAYTDESGSQYREDWCEKYRELCLQNYDLNIKFFSLLDYADFNNAITLFLKNNKEFQKVENLKIYDGISGYYMMILDEYKQVYIGKSNDIKRRIQQHWSSTKSFDRILYPMYAVTTSCFSIDFFRALDTTRIFAWERDLSDGVEKNLIAVFPERYRTNRIGGDISSGIEALATLNRREFQK